LEYAIYNINSESDPPSLPNNEILNETLVTPAGNVMAYGPGI